MTPRDKEPITDHSRNFWQTAFTIHGSALPQVIGRTLFFGAFAAGVYLLNKLIPPHLGISVAPYEIGGGVLGLLLVLRTNAGYERWWEARKLWGSIVNQSRDLALTALANGPDDPAWRDRVVRLSAAFPHVVRHRLRKERVMPRVAVLLGKEETARIALADHMPSYVSLLLARSFREGRDRLGLDPFVFLQLDKDRALLVDHVGGCERILKTPLPRIYAIEIHRFIVLFLFTLPFALIDKLHQEWWWAYPLATLTIAYPLLALDQIGIDLQNPFDDRRLGHLDLDGLCETIETNLMTLLESDGLPQPGSGLFDESRAVPLY